MKFRFVKEVNGKVATYNKKKVATGDTIELEGHFAEKAINNPDFEEIVEDGNEDSDKS